MFNTQNIWHLNLTKLKKRHYKILVCVLNAGPIFFEELAALIC